MTFLDENDENGKKEKKLFLNERKAFICRA